MGYVLNALYGKKQIAMEPVEMAINGTKQVSPDHLSFARRYYLLLFYIQIFYC